MSRENSIKQLEQYVRNSKYIEKAEQPKICASFGLPYMTVIFRKEYTRRFVELIKIEPTTVATVSKATGVPQKYLTQVKRNQEKKGLLQVVKFDRCPTTKSSNVQFVSSNPDEWNYITNKDDK